MSKITTIIFKECLFSETKMDLKMLLSLQLQQNLTMHMLMD